MPLAAWRLRQRQAESGIVYSHFGGATRLAVPKSIMPIDPIC